MVRKNIVLIGFMGTGKSSIGRLLAHHLACQFVDTDRRIIQRAGLEISEIFSQFGEAHFRDLESAALESLTEKEFQIVATGGGIILREQNRAALKQLGLVVGLTANEEVLFERVSRNRKRPLLQTENPRETIRKIITERESLYRETAQLSIDTSDLTQDQVAQIILAEARQRLAWPSAS